MNTRKDTLSRRGFLTGATTVGTAAVVSGGLLAGCGGPAGEVSSLPKKWDRETDVLVVGAGAAGLAAAIEAADAGSEVIVLEKEPVTGGNMTLCMGLLGGYDSRLMKENGIHVSKEDIYAYSLISNPSADPEMLNLIIDQSGETIDWLETLGVSFENHGVFGDPSYTTLPCLHMTDGGGRDLGKALPAAAKQRGAEILTETKAQSLFADETGRVVGVAAESGGETINIKARKATVLASAGYASNPNMIATLVPLMAGVQSVAAAGSTGDGIIMAGKLGAMTLRTSDVFVFATADIETLGVVYYDAIHSGGILVGEDAQRFCREDLSTYRELPPAILRQIKTQENDHIWMIMIESPGLLYTIDQTHPAVAKADTLEELAEKVDLDAGALKATVEHYNELCKTGEDADFGRNAQYLVPIDAAPFYAARVKPTIILTNGGLKINTRAEVLTVECLREEGAKEVIPGLYAAGQVAEWNAGTGFTVGSCFTMGRIAGQNAAAETPIA